jgi:hypothetical protein
VGDDLRSGTPVAEVFDDVVTYVVQDPAGVPLDPGEQPVDAIRTRMYASAN